MPGYGVYADSPGAVFLGKQFVRQQRTRSSRGHRDRSRRPTAPAGWRWVPRWRSGWDCPSTTGRSRSRSPAGSASRVAEAEENDERVARGLWRLVASLGHRARPGRRRPADDRRARTSGAFREQTERVLAEIAGRRRGSGPRPRGGAGPARPLRRAARAAGRAARAAGCRRSSPGRAGPARRCAASWRPTTGRATPTSGTSTACDPALARALPPGARRDGVPAGRPRRPGRPRRAGPRHRRPLTASGSDARTPQVGDLRGPRCRPAPYGGPRSGADDLAGADARGARVDPATVARGHEGLHGLDVRVPTARRAAVRVRHRHTETGALATHIAHGSHGGSLPGFVSLHGGARTATAYRPSASLAARSRTTSRGPGTSVRVGTLRPCCRCWTTPRPAGGAGPRSPRCPRRGAGSTSSTSSRCPTATPAPTCCSPPRRRWPRSTRPRDGRVDVGGAGPRRGAGRPRQLRHDPRPGAARPRRPAGRRRRRPTARPSPPPCRARPRPPTGRSPTRPRAPSSPSPGPAGTRRSPRSPTGARELAEVVRAAADGARVALEATPGQLAALRDAGRGRRRRRRAVPGPRRAGHHRHRRGAGPPAAGPPRRPPRRRRPAPGTATTTGRPDVPHQPPAGPGSEVQYLLGRRRRGRGRPAAGPAGRPRRQPRRRRRGHPHRPGVERARARRRRRCGDRGRHRGRPAVPDLGHPAGPRAAGRAGAGHPRGGRRSSPARAWRRCSPARASSWSPAARTA